MKKILSRYLSLFICLSMLLGLNIGIVKANALPTYPKNVIMLIGDGMGFNHVAAARDQKGSALYMDGLQYSGQAGTANYSGGVTDSAAAGTALACGVKTYNSRVGMDISGASVQNLSEYFKGFGKKAGIVTTSYVADATPGAFSAHELSRYNYNAIAIDQIEGSMDIIMGGGRWFYDVNPYHYSNQAPAYLLDVAVNERGYTYVSDRNGLMAANADKLLGLFVPESYMTLDTLRDPEIEPSLAEMTTKSIELLSSDPDGFFLMVEGGQIDTESHDNNLANAIGETLAFDLAVDAALDFLAENPDTLVIVTADHETGGLTYDGTPPTYHYTSINHTGVDVPIYASGIGAENFAGNLINTDIPNRIKQLAGNSCEGVSFYDYKLSGTTIKGLSDRLNIAEFTDGIYKSDNTTLKFMDKNGLEMSAPGYSGRYEYVGTGVTIEVYNNEALSGTYNAMLRGDVNGDGRMNGTDIYAIRRHMLGFQSLQGGYLTAANVDADINGFINGTDLLKIKNHILGLDTINQQ